MSRENRKGVKNLGKAFKLFEGIANEVYDRGGDDEGLARMGLKSVQSKIADILMGAKEALANTFSITVVYIQSLKAMIESGHYDWVNGDVTEKHFPLPRQSGTEELDVELVHFNRPISSDDALHELDRMGFRAATLPELLAFGSKYPEEQRKYPIVALGSVWRDDFGDRRVADLYGLASGRSLHLYWCEDDWNSDCRFLAVRK